MIKQIAGAMIIAGVMLLSHYWHTYWVFLGVVLLLFGLDLKYEQRDK